MKTLYIECAMGAAGDMLMAALLELHPDPEAFLQTLNALGLPDVRITAERSVKCGITGTHVSVSIHGAEETSEDAASFHSGHHEHAHDHSHTHTPHEEAHIHPPADAQHHAHGDMPHGRDHAHPHDHATAHAHHSMHTIEHLLNDLPITDTVRANALAVYALIAQAESHAHGVPVTEIHFHEVGSLDAIADIVGVCMLMEALAPERVMASPIHVGSGQVRCAHGILPVPAPATAYILRDVPIHGGDIRGELCTPTGAALLKHFAHSFGPMPEMAVSMTGYGMGKKDFPAANCVRTFWGATQEAQAQVCELMCNLDDMTPEAIGFAQQALLQGGALDVYTMPIGMKKGRPGVLLTCMCTEATRDAMLALLFRHTTTLGIRAYQAARYTLARRSSTRQTPLGTVRYKEAEGYGVRRRKYEYEDIAKIAGEEGISLQEVMDRIDPQVW